MLTKRPSFAVVLYLLVLTLAMSIPTKFRSLLASAFVKSPPLTTNHLMQTCSRSSIISSPALNYLPGQCLRGSSRPKSSIKTNPNLEFKRYDSMAVATATAVAMNRSSEYEGTNRGRKERPKRGRNEAPKRKNETWNKQNVRDDFRSTRVFVQGIPESVSWQDLKDHFRVAGDVAFASVSIDTVTGISKGCGIVQFETAEMANRAIEIMRDHPLDGAVLYVREDFQETKEGQEARKITSNNSNNRSSSSSTPPTIWKCADDSNLSLMSQEDLNSVKNLIKARDEARRRKSYDTSDIIREDLKKKFSVHLDDRMKLWWISGDNSVPKSISDIKGDGRWGKLKPWRQIPTTMENDACVNADLVNGLLSQRDIARREKDFATADKLLEEARSSPDGNLTLRIHDESRTWRIWTDEPPPRPVMEQTKKMGPAEQCVMIVEKYEPSKVNEVKSLLAKFPGREYNILKKLKQNYNA